MFFIFDKILNSLNMDNWATKRNKPSTKISLLSNTQNVSPVPLENNLLLSIKKYWETNPCSYNNRVYRNPTFKELQEYAKIEILSCFNRARGIDNFSECRLNQLGITNWHLFFSMLINDGYLRKANVTEILNSYTLKNLKIIADSLGISKSGNKPKLAQRIVCSLSFDQKQAILSKEDLFILTEKGKRYLSYQEDYVLLSKHSNCNVSLSEFNDNRIPDGVHKRNFYDTMFQVLSERIFFNEHTKNYEHATIDHLHVFEIMMEEAMNTELNVPLEVALSHYVEYLYLMSCFSFKARSVNGGYSINNYEYISLPKIHKDVPKLRDYKDSINFDVIFSNKPPSFLTKEEFIDCINEIFDDPMFDYQKWDKILQMRLYHYSKLMK